MRKKRSSVKKAKTKSTKKPENQLLNLKINGKERAALKAKAKKYTKGNLSAWVRYASQKFSPSVKSVRI